MYTPEQMHGVCGKEIATNTFHCIPVRKLTTVVSFYLPTIHMHRTHNNQVVWVIFLGRDFVKNVLKRKNILSQILYLGGRAEGAGKLPKPKFLKNFHHFQRCLQYERVLKNFYFHILNLVKFG